MAAAAAAPPPSPPPVTHLDSGPNGGLLKSPVPVHLADHQDDEQADQKGYIKGTDYATPYMSRFSRMQTSPPFCTDAYRHVNCGYLSTQGVPPTLLALKSHAQSLCRLIQLLCPTLESAELLTDGDPLVVLPEPKTKTKTKTKDGGDDEADELARERDEEEEEELRRRMELRLQDPLTVKYRRNDAFDFLTDLTQAYDNTDPNHQKPLNSLLNEVEGRNEAYGTRYHCPLVDTVPRARGEVVKPYSNHHALVMHANDALERLDNDLAATGGLLSLLPTEAEHEAQDLRDARNSLLGQWLVFTQHLVARMHELERSYGNALDALSGEAVVPRQHLSALGPDGRSGREIAYPQDRYVLVNAGDDVFNHVHDLLDREEAMVQQVEKAYRSVGVASAAMWHDEKGGSEHIRGIVYVDVKTRYYRLMGQGRNTVFVVPAWDAHPSVVATKKLEAEPTLVACVQPKFPVRSTELEKRLNAEADRARKSNLENYKLMDRVRHTDADIGFLRDESTRAADVNAALIKAITDANGSFDARLVQQNADQAKRINDMQEEKRQADDERSKLIDKQRQLEKQYEEAVADTLRQVKETKDLRLQLANRQAKDAVRRANEAAIAGTGPTFDTPRTTEELLQDLTEAIAELKSKQAEVDKATVADPQPMDTTG